MNIGIDLGYGAIKIASPKGTYQLPSFVGVAQVSRIANTEGAKRSKASTHIIVDGNAYRVGSNAHSDGKPLENLDYERLLGSPEIKALTFAALVNHDTTENIDAMVGLPLGLLSEESAKSNAAAVRKWMLGTHNVIVDGKAHTITINSVGITSQPIGALYDYILTSKGKPHKSNAATVKGEVGIISVGFNTIEMYTMRNKATVQRLSSSTKNGVRRLLELCDPHGHHTLGEKDDLLRAGVLDVSAQKPIWSREVRGDIEKTWGDVWQRFGSIIAVGGGTIILNGSMEQYEDKMHKPDDPVFSIASGLYKNLVRKNG